MNSIKEVVAYCAANIEDWDIKCGMALSYIGNRMPIPTWFRNEIEDKVSEWCDEHEVSLDFFEDWEDIAEEIVLWEEC